MTDSTAAAAPARIPETKSFSGSYLLFRKDGAKLKRPGAKSTPRAPRFRHPDFESAEREAQRLLGIFPDSTFIVLHEVARVKMKEVGPEPRFPVEGDPAHVFEAHARWAVEMEQANG